MLKTLQNELDNLIERSLDQTLRLAVTGLSQSGENHVYHRIYQSAIIIKYCRTTATTLVQCGSSSPYFGR